MVKAFLFCVIFFFSFSPSLFAHFGMVIPSASTVWEKKDARISIGLAFAHPMELRGMALVKPASFRVFAGGAETDLTPSLKTAKFLGEQAWVIDYALARPGAHQFVMEPEPYWEAAEDCFIIHYTKTVVAAFGGEEGWDIPLGLRAEIVPLTRPFAIYAGSVFQGRVLLDGKPAPGAEVEVEFYNREKKYEAPNGYFVTQVVKADDNGVFTYCAPFAGWWGFAALSRAPETRERAGEAKPVELGAVLWVEFSDPLVKR